MNVVDLIKAEKTNLQIGAWAQGHIPRSAFPMSRLKDKRYKFGPDYYWRLIKFSACGAQCRILLQLNLDKEIFRARFGVERGADMVVLCSHEFHATEPGWHCHVTLDEAGAVDAGAARDGKVKWPKQSSRKAFGVTRASALSHAAEFFRFKEQGELV